MKTVYATLFALVAGFNPLVVQGDELTPEKREAIQELLSMTDAVNVGRIFGDAYVQQMAITLKQINPSLDPKFVYIVEEEVHAIIDEELTEKQSLHERMIPVYHRYLTLDETRELIRFYKSPVGQKAMNVVPKMVEEGTLITQQWGMSLVPKIEERVLIRLQQEGVQVSY